jgi:hypothetical protein
MLSRAELPGAPARPHAAREMAHDNTTVFLENAVDRDVLETVLSVALMGVVLLQWAQRDPLS